MAKNRKTQSDTVRFGAVARVLVLCLFFGGSAIGYVWQQGQIMKLNVRRKALETVLGDLQVQNRRRSDQFESQLLPKALEDRVRGMNLGLAPHNPAQVVRLVEPAVGMPAAIMGGQKTPDPRITASAEFP
jgi:hypothetical protein